MNQTKCKYCNNILPDNHINGFCDNNCLTSYEIDDIMSMLPIEVDDIEYNLDYGWSYE